MFMEIGKSPKSGDKGSDEEHLRCFLVFCVCGISVGHIMSLCGSLSKIKALLEQRIGFLSEANPYV